MKTTQRDLAGRSTTNGCRLEILFEKIRRSKIQEKDISELIGELDRAILAKKQHNVRKALLFNNN